LLCIFQKEAQHVASLIWWWRSNSDDFLFLQLTALPDLTSKNMIFSFKSQKKGSSYRRLVAVVE